MKSVTKIFCNVTLFKGKSDLQACHNASFTIPIIFIDDSFC